VFGLRAGGDSSIGYEDSWYYATARELQAHAALTGDLKAHVCIVGAGYTGLSAAIELAERGYEVVVLESHKVGSGASGRNGGVLGMGQRKDQDELEAMVGIDDAKKFWQIACDANRRRDARCP
jgi:gamma-glutamylputrescine oxidase